MAKPKKNMKGRPRGGASVPCPMCHQDSRVVITRREADEVMRTRQCTGRGHHLFKTVEQVG